MLLLPMWLLDAMIAASVFRSEDGALGEKKENDNPVEMVAAMAGFASVVIGILDVTRVNTGARLLDFGSRGLGRVRTRLAGLLAGSVRSARASPATKG